ncbi:MAG: HEAT repeat domain-containing protein [Pirellulales bacterium]|nr:HEAT repeat domain-containing protein [Pirellulales bacterium]
MQWIKVTIVVLGVALLGGCGSREATPNTAATAATVGEVEDAGPTQEQIEAARSELPPPPQRPLLVGLGAPPPERGVNEAASDALGRIGEAAIPALLEALRDPDPLVRAEAVRALARMGPEAEPALDALIAALQDGDKGVRRAAAGAIGQIGPAAKKAIPALVQALRDYEQDAGSTH